MPDTSTTDLRELADVKMRQRGPGLDETVADLRARGYGWRAVAVELRVRHGVNVSKDSLHRWYGADS